ncbi:hypothetical protein AVEN_28729-1 [Araneus ventricosus]|uniref:Uncharacterized protein n=1 Tax=Araneus ventricosus TaxID=182803 RepID=A0A4Y2KH67_ARAVE|nr:hypothetical protein AVEN_156181-1 [Araneus ventricosus]GBO01985.1 hypothetical protein AVEN_28729-1 [Araneus ventricosus]
MLAKKPLRLQLRTKKLRFDSRIEDYAGESASLPILALKHNIDAHAPFPTVILAVKSLLLISGKSLSLSEYKSAQEFRVGLFSSSFCFSQVFNG